MRPKTSAGTWTGMDKWEVPQGSLKLPDDQPEKLWPAAWSAFARSLFLKHAARKWLPINHKHAQLPSATATRDKLAAVTCIAFPSCISDSSFSCRLRPYIAHLHCTPLLAV